MCGSKRGRERKRMFQNKREGLSNNNLLAFLLRCGTRPYEWGAQ